MNTDTDTSPHARPLLAIFLLFAIPLLIGCAIAPHVFNGLRALGETTDMLTKITEARFERVASRCVMLVAVLMLYPIIKMTGLLPRVRHGLIGTRERYRELGTSIAVACISMSLLYAFGYYLGAYDISPKIGGPGILGLKTLEFLLGAVFIGIFEEVFFRGFIFGGLRSRLSFPMALVLSSVIFSGIHFLRPLYPTVIEIASWHSGFSILPYMFERFVWEKDAVFAATLFMMGLTLATYYEKRGSLYFIIGLHGGWVLAMRLGSYILNRQKQVYPSFFGNSDFISKGWLALMVVTLFYIAALCEKRKVEK